MTERRDSAPRGDIAPADRAWFDRTCRAQARVGCRGRPDLWDDAEAEARLAGWLAYRAGLSRALVAFKSREGAAEFLRREVGRSKRRDPATGAVRNVLTGHVQDMTAYGAEPLTLTGADGAERENPALPAAPDPYAPLLAAAAARALLDLLPPREGALLWRVAEGAPQKEVAAEWGVSRHSVHAACRRALRRLRASPDVAALLR